MSDLCRESAGNDFVAWYREKNPEHPREDAIGFALFQCEMQTILNIDLRASTLYDWKHCKPEHEERMRRTFLFVCENTSIQDQKNDNFIRDYCHYKDNHRYTRYSDQREKEIRGRAAWAEEKSKPKPAYPFQEIEAKQMARVE
jgi:hypothetical protein